MMTQIRGDNMLKSKFATVVLILSVILSINVGAKQVGKVDKSKASLDSYSNVVDKVSPSVVQVFVETRVPVFIRDRVSYREILPLEKYIYYLVLPLRTYIRPIERYIEVYINKHFYRYVDMYYKKPIVKKKYRTMRGCGTGFIVNEKGYILTNSHVVLGMSKIWVEFSDGSSYKAKLKGIDTQTDLALLTIKTKRKLVVATLGDSAKVKVGDKVLAMGYPFALDKTVTAGIISAINVAADMGLDTKEDMLQIDAAINHGNSGGPLVNMKGEVIGINELLYSPVDVFCGVGYAINSNLIKSVLYHLKTYGYVRRGYIGLDAYNTKKGVKVDYVYKYSPAYMAKIKIGDIIVKVGKVKVSNLKQLKFLIDYKLADTKTTITVIRKGKAKVLKIFIEDFLGEDDNFLGGFND